MGNLAGEHGFMEIEGKTIYENMNDFNVSDLNCGKIRVAKKKSS